MVRQVEARLRGILQLMIHTGSLLYDCFWGGVTLTEIFSQIQVEFTIQSVTIPAMNECGVKLHLVAKFLYHNHLKQLTIYYSQTKQLQCA